ncbi:MAG: phytanoyl-CoA dioxygenase family protein [Alphaproteobacteria bacterium]|nr:phytanoyl-CoA dioxygenase family protein [Alphaproteobacteria bacterium]
MTLTQQQIERFWETGYLVLPGALPADLLAELQREADLATEGARGLEASDARYDLEDSHRAHAPRVRRLKTPFEHWPFFDRLMRSAAVLDAVEPLLGPDIRIHNSKLNMKSAHFGAAVEWHQDWAFYPHTNDTGLALGIYLDDVGEDNGPMMAVPGSHRGPVFDHHSAGAFCGGIDPGLHDVGHERAAEMTGPAGTFTLHHVRAVHGSALNRSNRPRRLLLYSYFAADAWPLMGLEGATLEEFDKRICRGKPTLEPRLEAAPVRMPLPIAPKQGSIYENQKTLSGRFFDQLEDVA